MANDSGVTADAAAVLGNAGNASGVPGTVERLLDEMREPILDALRARWGDEDGAVDEFTDAQYAAIAEEAVRVIGDHFMHRDGPGYVVEELCAMREALAHYDRDRPT